MWVLLRPQGINKTYFAWGFGIATNNHVEALFLWKGFHIAKEKGIDELRVVGDSGLIIQHL